MSIDLTVLKLEAKLVAVLEGIRIYTTTVRRKSLILIEVGQRLMMVLTLPSSTSTTAVDQRGFDLRDGVCPLVSAKQDSNLRKELLLAIAIQYLFYHVPGIYEVGS